MGYHSQTSDRCQTVFADIVRLRNLSAFGLLVTGAIALFKPLPAKATGIGILGDSISTGAASHPQLVLDGKGLWEVFLNPDLVTPRAEHLPKNPALATPIVDPIAPPQVAWPTSREFDHGASYSFLTMINAIGQVYLNTEEYSWGYQLALELGVPASSLVIAAENGARITGLNRQVDRLLKANGGQLPSKVFIFFTGNDICGPTPDRMTEVADFKDALKSGVEYLQSKKQAEHGTQVFVVSFLNITQIVTRPEILAKPLAAFGEPTTCQKLLEQKFQPTPAQVAASNLAITGSAELSLTPQNPTSIGSLPSWFPWIFAQVMPPSPAGMCPNLFGSQDPAVLSAVANRIRAIRQVSQEVVKGFNDQPTSSPRFKVTWLGSPEALVFDQDDIAGDCFHLSARGQSKIARSVLHDLNSSQIK